MEYHIEGNNVIVRLDPGDEIIQSIQEICEKESIFGATIFGIGATNHVIIAYFDKEKRKYLKKEYKGNLEITSLVGNVSRMKEKPYIHLHINIADEKNRVIGGHLSSSTISITCEIIISLIPSLTREKNQNTGINELKCL